MIRLAVSGCQGRMGQRIAALAKADSQLQLSVLLEHKDHPKAKEAPHGIAISTSSDALKEADVLIDFTTPEATLLNLKACTQHGVKMVIGTTGLTPAQIGEIRQASTKIPIVYSSNMSVGVNILFRLANMLAEKATSDYTVTMTEAHHIHKKDAPSGTAKTLAEIIEKASGRKVSDIQSIREGEIIGDHEVVFESPEDTLTIKHHAKNRDIFAKGSLVAAKFLATKTKGLFSMQDVLGLS